MVKRKQTPQATQDVFPKKWKVQTDVASFKPIKVATPEAAAAVDANPPFKQLANEMKNVLKTPATGKCVVFWMRMNDLRRELLTWWGQGD